MPELPEVETICRGLASRLEGRRLTRVIQRREDLRFPLPAQFPERLTGRQILRLQRRAKYLLMVFDNDLVLVSHLGMSGRFFVRPIDRNATAGPHDHVEFETDDGFTVIYSDPRRFGFMDLVEGDQMAAHPRLADLGVEPLGNNFSEEYLSAALGTRKAPVKAALLDQKLVAGLGNIYVCEALWRARISPRRRADRVGGRRAGRLAAAIRQVLLDAIDAGGSSLRDYQQADGELGYFQHAFAVYDREGAACARAGCGGIIKRLVQSGRSSFYCPGCQR